MKKFHIFMLITLFFYEKIFIYGDFGISAIFGKLSKKFDFFPFNAIFNV